MQVPASQQPPLPEQTRHVLELALKTVIDRMEHVRECRGAYMENLPFDSPSSS